MSSGFVFFIFPSVSTSRSTITETPCDFSLEEAVIAGIEYILDHLL